MKQPKSQGVRCIPAARSWQYGMSLLLVVMMLVGAALACEQGTSPDAIQIDELPQYICPSSTPRPTDTPMPTSLPTYPLYFTANLSNYLVGDMLNTVTVQWYAQNAGTIYLSYSGVMNVSPFFWPGASNIPIGAAPYGQPARYGYYTLVIPFNVTSASIQVWADSAAPVTLGVLRLVGPVSGYNPPPPPGAPPPIYPTPYPTYTPYPTPTTFILTNDYFIGDSVYTSLDKKDTPRARFRLVEVRQMVRPATPTPESATETPVPGMVFTPAYVENIYIWTFTIKNLGKSELNFYPPMQSFVTTIEGVNGSQQHGAWGATLLAAELAGIDQAGYDIFSLLPNQEVQVTLAAFAPQLNAWRISWAMDPSQPPPSPLPGETALPVAAGNIVSWINAENTICSGEISEP